MRAQPGSGAPSVLQLPAGRNGDAEHGTLVEFDEAGSTERRGVLSEAS